MALLEAYTEAWGKQLCKPNSDKRTYAMSTKGFPIKTRIVIKFSLIVDRIVTHMQQVHYNNSWNKMQRGWDREHRNQAALRYTADTNYNILRKDDSYSDWYCEMNEIRQARRLARYPNQRGIIA